MPVWPLVPGGQVPKAGVPGYGLHVDRGGHKGGFGRKIYFVKKKLKFYITLLPSIKIVDHYILQTATPTL